MALISLRAMFFLAAITLLPSFALQSAHGLSEESPLEVGLNLWAHEHLKVPQRARQEAHRACDVDFAHDRFAEAIELVKAELDAGLDRAKALGVAAVPAYFMNGQLIGTGALSEGALRSVILHTCNEPDAPSSSDSSSNRGSSLRTPATSKVG